MIEDHPRGNGFALRPVAKAFISKAAWYNVRAYLDACGGVKKDGKRRANNFVT